MTILDRGNSEISGTNSQSHQLDSGKIEEVLRTFKILKRGFSEEKKMMSRLRCHVTKIQELKQQLFEQQCVVDEAGLKESVWQQAVNEDTDTTTDNGRGEIETMRPRLAVNQGTGNLSAWEERQLQNLQISSVNTGFDKEKIFSIQL